LVVVKESWRPPAGAGPSSWTGMACVSPAFTMADPGKVTAMGDTTVRLRRAGVLTLFERSTAVARTSMVAPGGTLAGTGISKTADTLPCRGVCFESE
jgi:hypothetical protein